MDSKAFRSPPAEYLGAPFWVWNCKLDKQELLDQMDIFREMGMGGVTIHCRTGLATEYMGEEFMDIVKACIEKAKQCGMKLYLYDEDRWPSGFAGGKVTQDHELRMRYINFLPAEMADETDGPLLARYNIMLKDGLLVSYRRLSEGENGENVWEAHCKTRDVGSRFNGQSYVDTLNPKAIARFIELTHEAYYNLAGQEFGKTIPSIFSDEPQIMNKTTLETPESRQEVHMPYTPDFPESYRTVYGEDLFDTLPEVFWERADGLASQARYRYHQHALERFAAAFPDQIGRWCEAHGIAFTGHLMEEQNLRVLTVESGEPMRLYRGFTVPGIDMLCDAREYSTAKQCQSVVHQMRRSEMTSEVYGVTNWDFDFRSHKMQGDWQAALGVTHRVHHLAWASMAGEAKRDYPASIFFQSSWYERYRLIEEHFGRLNTVLQTGTPIVKIGVIHPIESYWLAFGPERQTAEVREALETQFSQTVEWLLFGQLDFDFIGEGLSETLESGQDKTGFRVGEMVYSVIVIPGCLTLRSSLMDRLEAFADAGGQILFMGNIPQYVDAVRSERPAKLAARCKQIPFDRLKLLAELEPYRTVRITGDTGVLCTEYLYQLRRDGDELFLFTTFGRRVDNPDAKNQNRNCQFNPDVPIAKSIVLSVPGTYEATLLDTMTGEQHALKVEHKNGWTYLHRALYLHDSLLLRLSPLTYNDAPEPPAPALVPVQVLDDVHSWKRDEPNVLMLDQAEYAWNSEKWHSREELLRIDTSLRQMCGLPVDAGDILTEQAVPGEIYEIAYEAYAGDGKREVRTGPIVDEQEFLTRPNFSYTLPQVGHTVYGIWNEDAYQLYLDMDVLMGLRNALPPDSMRVMEINNALKKCVNALRMEEGREAMQESFLVAREILAPLLNCKNGSTAPTMYAFGHSHLDLAWLWTNEETVRKCGRSFSTQLHLMDLYPEYTFLQSQPYLYEQTKINYPELYSRIREKVRTGQFLPEGGMWVEADTNMPCGESLIRQFLYGKRFFREEFGVESELLWLPDVFGYSAVMPQIMKGCGIRYFATQKLAWSYNDCEPFPYSYFSWQGLDGSRVTAFLDRDYGAYTNSQYITDSQKYTVFPALFRY